MHETQTVPDQHSDLVGGSTAGRRLNCPASYALEQLVPKDKGSIYANEGTTLHEIMTKLLLNPTLDPYDILPFEFTHKDGWSYTVDADIWDANGAPALDAFLDYMDAVERETGGAFSYIVEKKCALPGIPGAFGTSDIVWSCGNRSGVWDWKFGYGAVSATENPQLMFYARAAMSDYPEVFANAEVIELAIMQPARGAEPDVWETDKDTIERFRIDLVAAVKEAQEKGAEGRMARGKHCDFARCKAVCPLHVNPAVALAAKLGLRKDQDAAEIAKGEPPLADDEAVGDEQSFLEMLPDLLELAEIAEEYAKEVFSRAANLAINDCSVRDMLKPHGWGLKEGRAGNLTWIAEEGRIKRALSSRGLTAAEYLVKKLITPTQAKAALKKIGKELPRELAENPPSKGPSFARLYPDTKEYQSVTDRVKALGERLATKV